MADMPSLPPDGRRTSENMMLQIRIPDEDLPTFPAFA